MKKRIVSTLIALLSCLSIAVMTTFSGCNNSDRSIPNESDTNDNSGNEQPSTDENGNKEALVYKGMSASANTGAAKSIARSPFNSGRNSTAEYSAYRNEDFYINVQFDNPKNYIILGLTISYAGTTELFPCNSFEDDCDSENVYVRVKAKKANSYDNMTEYTISNITYSDGAEIKSAVYAKEANKSIYVAINQYGTDVDRTQAITGTKLNCLDKDMLSADGKLTIPQGITEIGEYAFAYDENINELIIPDTVKTIGVGAFYDCLSLEKVTIGAGVEFIDKYAFHNCENISYVNYTGTLTDWCEINFAYTEEQQAERMLGNNIDKDVRYSNPTFYAHNLHIKGELITEVIIPQEITAVKYATFARCTSIKKVILHENVQSIGYYAFLTCTGIDELDLGGVRIIDASAFDGCYGLTQLTLPETLTEIKFSQTSSESNGAFRAAQKIITIYNLSELNIEKRYNSNGAVAKYAMEVYDEKPADSNFSTDSDGFVWYSNTNMENEVMLVGYAGSQKEITVPVTHEGNRVILKECAFAGNTVLEKVIFEEGFTQIPNRLFAYCFTLKEVVLPESITSIGNHAFWSSGLEKIVLPKSCTYLYQFAFSECKNLNITIKATQLTFEKHALGSNINLQITFAGTVEQWSNYVNSLNSTTNQGMLYGSDFTAICSNGTYKAYGI